jgi:hypothetical protein
MRRGNLFVRLHDFEFEEFLKRTLPALEALEPITTIKLLATKLKRGVEATLESDQVPYAGESTTWCRDLTQPDSLDGELAQLARALAAVSARASTNRERVEEVLGILETFEGEIFDRIRLHVLSVAGQCVPDRLDAFFESQGAIEPGFRGREVAAVLRNQFQNASEQVQRRFKSALEEGPTHNKEEDAAEFADRARRWRRRRLLWFRDRLPSSLRELANTVGVSGEPLSPHDEGLAEDGFYVGGGYVGEESPISVDQLATMTPDRFIDYIVAWRPDPVIGPFPTRGLERTITEYAKAHPVDAVARLQRLVKSSALRQNPLYAQACVDGLKAAVEAEKEIDWEGVFPLLVDLLREVEQNVPSETAETFRRPWRWLGTSVMDFVIAVSRKNSVSDAQIEALWQIAEQITRSPCVWQDGDQESDESIEDLVTASLNHSAGRATEALLEVALSAFRVKLGIPELEATTEELELAKGNVAPRLRPLLEYALSQLGRPGAIAHAVVGAYLPQIHFLDRVWLIEAAPALFRGGASTPLERPTWSVYITRARFHPEVFKDLRNWYAVAVSAIEATLLAVGTDQSHYWSPTQHLGEHLFAAFMFGLIEPNDPDKLMLNAFDKLPANERAQISWMIFRSWTDASQAPSEATVRRLIEFWRWRLETLETLPDSEATREDFTGLTWLICTPHLPDAEVLRLAVRTIRGSNGRAAARGAIWERLDSLVEVDIDSVFDVAERLVRAALQKPFPYITVKQTRRVLEAAIARGNPDTSDRAKRLINTLGDRGMVEFGELLQGRP